MLDAAPSWLTALVLGGAVGLGVAMPLGAIAVLLLETGMTHGWRPAAAGGLGAASVDLVFAAVAVISGTAVSALLASHQQVVRLVGALVLAAVAAHGLVRTVRSGGGGSDVAAVLPRRAAASYARFVALTVLNPLTVVYFTVVAAGMADRLTDVVDRVAFVAGIGAVSALWQLGLAAAGAILGTRLGSASRTALSVAGYLVVGGFAVVLLMR